MSGVGGVLVYLVKNALRPFALSSARTRNRTVNLTTDINVRKTPPRSLHKPKNSSHGGVILPWFCRSSRSRCNRDTSVCNAGAKISSKLSRDDTCKSNARVDMLASGGRVPWCGDGLSGLGAERAVDCPVVRGSAGTCQSMCSYSLKLFAATTCAP